ncbi:hypothetical protein A0H76_1806 [Hepatospora eriocheir]|uniref:CLASP N-terminal domain-containing protein n=1 Tax=Hepatospora eriocheir TaxID=1081669 RepID=A0A1X0QGG4_9MICR|nr:hypothetical protein A0H76_1806 [Hepatospora eriocheir]
MPEGNEERIMKSIKEAERLFNLREDEVTWFKINSIFSGLRDYLDSFDLVEKYFINFTSLLQRSIQSDRSMLNGTCTRFFDHCLSFNKQSKQFINYVPIFIKLTGKTNKILASRAQNSLLLLSKLVDVGVLSKMFTDPIKSNSKSIRIAVFNVLEKLINKGNVNTFKEHLEVGSKDPTIEIRTICKNINKKLLQKEISTTKENIVNKVNKVIKKSTTSNSRKKNDLVVKAALSKTNPLKSHVIKERLSISKYFNNPIKKTNSTQMEDKMLKIKLEEFRKSANETPVKISLNQNDLIKSINENNKYEFKNKEILEQNVLSFLDETYLYNSEVNHSNNPSLEHVVINEGVANEILPITSDHRTDLNINNLNHSFMNISIEPSIVKEESVNNKDLNSNDKDNNKDLNSNDKDNNKNLNSNNKDLNSNDINDEVIINPIKVSENETTYLVPFEVSNNDEGDNTMEIILEKENVDNLDEIIVLETDNNEPVVRCLEFNNTIELDESYKNQLNYFNTHPLKKIRKSKQKPLFKKINQVKKLNGDYNSSVCRSFIVESGSSEVFSKTKE